MGLKTLVVEDDPVMRRMFEILVGARGHSVTACDNALDALSAYQVDEHPLVLLDWMMAGMDGLELCQHLRRLPSSDSTVILMITGRNRPEDLKTVLEAGADDYLTKPVQPELLNIRLTIAEQVVQQRAERRAAKERLAVAIQRLEHSHDDLLSILNGLRIGAVMTDAEGRVTFLNELACRLLGPSDELEAGPWLSIFPVGHSEKVKLTQTALLSASQREKVMLTFDTRKGTRVALEVEIQDDPREPSRKIILLYDVTAVHDLRRQLSTLGRYDDMVGKSAGMQQVYQLIQDVGRMETTVLIEGETGTGKELVARSIHKASHRREKPFIAVNCAGLTDSLLSSQLFGHRRGAFTGAVSDHAGLFEAANGGTIFLDEIGDIPMSVQTSLLRVLQEREITRLGESKPRKIDVRVVAATHRDLGDEVRKGNFRPDLLYRIRVARVRLPPLRERREDIPLLVSTFLSQFRASTGKEVDAGSNEALRRLLEYPWPGNVREVRSAIEFAVIRCRGTVFQLEDLPPELQLTNIHESEASRQEGELPLTDDRERIEAALRRARGNRTVAAKLLGMSRATFYRRLAQVGIGEDDGGGA